MKRKREEKRKSDTATKSWKCFILQKHSTKIPWQLNLTEKSEISGAKHLRIDFN